MIAKRDLGISFTDVGKKIEEASREKIKALEEKRLNYDLRD